MLLGAVYSCMLNVCCEEVFCPLKTLSDGEESTAKCNYSSVACLSSLAWFSLKLIWIKAKEFFCFDICFTTPTLLVALGALF